MKATNNTQKDVYVFLSFGGTIWNILLKQFHLGFIANLASSCCSDSTESNGKCDHNSLHLPST